MERMLLEELLVERRLALLRHMSTDKSYLASLLGRACLLSKFDVHGCGAIISSWNLLRRLLLSPLFVSKDTTMLGLMLQAMNCTGIYL